MTDNAGVERANSISDAAIPPGSRNPYLFLVGCPRSGTTLLQRMLDNHPVLAVANDTHFIPKGIEGSPALPDTELTQDMVQRVRGYRRFSRLGVTDVAVDEAAAKSHTYSEFVGALFDSFGRLKGKPLAGEKTPDYVRKLPELHAMFPWARTLHIIRDGRDVALSAQEWARNDKGPGRLKFWKEEPVGVAALWWRWQVGTGARSGAALGPDHYQEIGYEELVAEPEKVLRTIAAFIGLPYSPDMGAYHVGKTVTKPGLSAKSAWLPPTPGLRSWRDTMSERDVELFEALAGDLLFELGYERTVMTFSPNVSEVAERLRSWWGQRGGSVTAAAPAAARA